MKFLATFLATLALVASTPIQNPMETDGMFEGDIAVENSKGLAQQATATNRWPGGVVTYVFADGTYTDSQKLVILSGMRLIEDSTRYTDSTGQVKNCITFKPRTDEASYIRIFSGSGCWSSVGQVSTSKPQDLSLKNPGCMTRGTSAHELIHALGFWHEQSRPDRDNYIKILWENIREGTEHNFNKYTSRIDTLGLPYDTRSIMHYQWNAFSKNGQPTIQPFKADVSLIGSSVNKLSDIDIAEIRKYYNCQ